MPSKECTTATCKHKHSKYDHGHLAAVSERSEGRGHGSPCSGPAQALRRARPAKATTLPQPRPTTLPQPRPLSNPCLSHSGPCHRHCAALTSAMARPLPWPLRAVPRPLLCPCLGQCGPCGAGVLSRDGVVIQAVGAELGRVLHLPMRLGGEGWDDGQAHAVARSCARRTCTASTAAAQAPCGRRGAPCRRA